MAALNYRRRTYVAPPSYVQHRLKAFQSVLQLSYYFQFKGETLIPWKMPKVLATFDVTSAHRLAKFSGPEKFIVFKQQPKSGIIYRLTP